MALAKTLLPLFGLVALANAPRLTAPVEPLAPDRPVETLLPRSTLVYVEAPGLAELLEQGVQHPAVARVLDSPIGRALDGERALDEALERLVPILGDAPLARIADLATKGAALGVAPRGTQPAIALVLLGDDAERTRETVQSALDAAAAAAGFPGAFHRPSDRVRGADVWYVGDELVVARRDALLVLGNEGGYVRDVLELAATSDAQGLAEREAFRAARGAERGAALLAWAFADLQRLRELPRASAGGLRGLRDAPKRPEVHFLLGPAFAALPTAATMTAWLEADGEGLALGVRGDGTDALAVLRERTGDAGPPIPAHTDGDVAVAVLQRDLAAIFEHRAELFPPEVLPRLSKPLSELAVLFGGRDVSEDVLPHLGPWLTLVARDVAFDEAAVPEIRLPALVGLVRLEDEGVGPRLTAAFQSLIAVGNIDRAQKAQDPMVLSLSAEGPVSITRAAFLEPAEGEGVDLRYNLEPACAQVGDLFVIGTHEALVRDVVRQVLDGDVRPRAGDGEHLTLDGAAIAELVAANREALVMNGVLDEGKTYEQSERDIAGLERIAAMLASGRLDVRHGPSGVELEARFAFDDRREEELR